MKETFDPITYYVSLAENIVLRRRDVGLYWEDALKHVRNCLKEFRGETFVVNQEYKSTFVPASFYRSALKFTRPETATYAFLEEQVKRYDK